MSSLQIGHIISERRKSLGFTQANFTNFPTLTAVLFKNLNAGNLVCKVTYVLDYLHMFNAKAKLKTI